MHWDYILLLAILGVLVPWRSAVRVRELLDGPALSSFERILVYLSTIAFQWIAVALILWRCMAHRVPLAEIGLAFPHPARAIFVAIGLSFILIINQVFGVRRIAGLPRENRGIIVKLSEKLLPRTPKEAWFSIFLIFTVAICEEFIYRGFVELIFTKLFANSVLLGVVLSAAFFASAHLYQGRKGIITTFVIGLIFSTVRIWTGSLASSIVVHFFVDLSAGIAAYKFLPFREDSVVAISLLCWHRTTIRP